MIEGNENNSSIPVSNEMPKIAYQKQFCYFARLYNIYSFVKAWLTNQKTKKKKKQQNNLRRVNFYCLRVHKTY